MFELWANILCFYTFEFLPLFQQQKQQQQQPNTQQIFKSIPLRITRDKCTAIVHKKSKHFWDIDVNKKGKSERTRDYRRAEVSTAS